jgi:hypothetical protein
MFLEERFNAAKPSEGEAVILAKTYRPPVAVHLELRFASISHYMNMSGSMVIRIDYDSQPGES